MGILAQILENLTNFYFGSDFANCTNFMWSKTSLEEGTISQKLQKFKHHDFIFKVSTPGINSYTWVTMWPKTSLEEGPISQKLRENAHSIFHMQALILRAFYTAHLVLLRIWRVLCYAYGRITNYIDSKFEMWLLIYTAHQSTKKLQKFKHHDFIFKVSTPPA